MQWTQQQCLERKGHNENLDLFEPITKVRIGGITNNHMTSMMFLLVPVETVLKPIVAVIPDIGGPPNQYFCPKEALWLGRMFHWLARRGPRIWWPSTTPSWFCVLVWFKLVLNCLFVHIFLYHQIQSLAQKSGLYLLASVCDYELNQVVFTWFERWKRLDWFLNLYAKEVFTLLVLPPCISMDILLHLSS